MAEARGRQVKSCLRCKVWPSALLIVMAKANLMGNCRLLKTKFFESSEGMIVILGKKNDVPSDFSISNTFG